MQWTCAAAASSSLFQSTGRQGSPNKPDLQIPPPPAQPMHQSASAAELAAQAREAEQQEQQQDQTEPNTTPNPTPAAAPKQNPSAQAETANREQAKDGASRTLGTDSGPKPAPGRDATVKSSSKDGGARAGVKDAGASNKGLGREAAGAAKAPGRIQPEARQEVCSRHILFRSGWMQLAFRP